ncbi:MAG: zinc ribbon domain-containing protein [Phycisphaerae bacterium]|nr:zinc ribbon domain-containing protein [Phycisphaerae bacterium]
MPTYDYRCTACKHAFELFQSMRDPVKRTCPECGKKALERLIGTGAALLFKGSGFYHTDYRSESYRKAAQDDAKPAGDAKPAESTPATAKADSPAPPPPAPEGGSKPGKRRTRR